MSVTGDRASAGLRWTLLVFCGGLAAWAFGVGAAGASAATLSYPDFTSTDGLTLNGEAQVSTDRLRLTDDFHQAGSAFTQQAVLNPSRPFSSRFSLHLHSTLGDIPADGMAFVIQRGPASALGDSGGGLGYHGIKPSIAVEFDTYIFEPPLAIHRNGNHERPAVEADSPFSIAGDPFNVWVKYTAGKKRMLRVFVSQAATKPKKPVLRHRVNLRKLLGGRARVGFTAGTGDEASLQDVLSWNLRTG